jgi:Ca-activated chloride channel homolog
MKIMKKWTFIIAVIILVTINFTASAKEIITGKVFNEKKQPLENVAISTQGKNPVTKTNQNGQFKIEIDSLPEILVFSLTGFETKEVKIAQRKNIEVMLIHEKTISEPIAIAEEIVVMDAVAGRSAMKCMAAPSPNIGYTTFNTEDYSSINENGFKSVKSNPLSTFSIDVDNASYSNIRRFINMGQLPPKDAVRTEEMINYFHYEYQQPKSDEPFSVTTEYSTCPWNENNTLMLVALQGKKIEKENLPPSNLVFLLDVSGSMNAQNKLPLVKSAMRMLAEELRPQDKVSIVVYAGAAGVVLDATPGSNKKKITDAIDNLNAGGSTAGGEGIKLAYKIAEENKFEGGNNRIILATDGDFNVGISSDSEMERLVEQERGKGIYVTVLGFGMGNYKDNKLETIADKGNGNYAYIDNLLEARKVLIKEFGGTLFTIAQDVKFQIEFNPAKIKGYRLIGYENRLLNDEDFNNDKKDAGEMGSGHQVTALYEIVPVGSETVIPEVDELKYQQKQGTVKVDFSKELLTIKVRYKKPGEENSNLITIPVPDSKVKFSNASNNFRFVSSIAQFGMILRDSEFRGSATVKNTIEMAKLARGNDEEGYAGEFIRLIETAGALGLK